MVPYQGGILHRSHSVTNHQPSPEMASFSGVTAPPYTYLLYHHNSNPPSGIIPAAGTSAVQCESAPKSKIWPRQVYRHCRMHAPFLCFRRPPFPCSRPLLGVFSFDICVNAVLNSQGLLVLPDLIHLSVVPRVLYLSGCRPFLGANTKSSRWGKCLRCNCPEFSQSAPCETNPCSRICTPLSPSTQRGFLFWGAGVWSPAPHRKFSPIPFGTARTTKGTCPQ